LELVEYAAHFFEGPGRQAPARVLRHRQIAVRFGSEPFTAILEDQALQASQALAAVDAPHRLVSFYDRHVRHDRPNAGLGCGQDEHVATAVRDSPGTDPFAVHVGAAFEITDGVLVVLDLIPRIQVLTRLTAACAEPAVVEHQGGYPLGGEGLRIARLA